MRPIVVKVQIATSVMVARSRLRSTTVEPAAAELTPPPSMSETPPPRPLCKSTSKMIASETITWIPTTIPVSTAAQASSPLFLTGVQTRRPPRAFSTECRIRALSRECWVWGRGFSPVSAARLGFRRKPARSGRSGGCRSPACRGGQVRRGR